MVIGHVLYNSGVITLIISNRPHFTQSADLTLLTQLPPELYSTQSNYHNDYNSGLHMSFSLDRMG